MRVLEAEALETQVGDLIALVGELSDHDFGRPTRCPGWSVAEVIAHCEGMLCRLVGENAQPVEGAAEIDRVGYYRYDPDGLREGEDPDKTFSDVIRDRVTDEVGGRAGGQLRASIEGAAEVALQGVHQIPAERVIKRSGHLRITFGEFVASRNLEFGVHTMDTAHAVGRPERPHPAAAVVISAILDALLGDPIPLSLHWDATAYILAGTGRREVEPGERAKLGALAMRFPCFVRSEATRRRRISRCALTARQPSRYQLGIRRSPRHSSLPGLSAPGSRWAGKSPTVPLPATPIIRVVLSGTGSMVGPKASVCAPS
ncbi:MAG: maleylpyruvate isomerase family mycothiol-dependent enzyme [Micromonosporaceae bacterium]